MSIVSKRSEIIFLYDVKNCNPNGDPMDANRPRISEETGRCLVTDVRLKRTVRDYLRNYLGYNGDANALGDIFIPDEPVTGTERAKSYATKDEFLTKFIDARLFGAVSAPKKQKKADDKKDAKKPPHETEEAEAEAEGGDDEGKSETDEKKTFHFTGPVQFGMGKSLNRVKENFIKGTGAFATKEESQQRTFREEYNITYGLIGFHGVVNENAARHTQLTDSDVKLLLDSLWEGTKNLLTRSKKGHMPRLLLKIDYAKSGFFIGDLLEELALQMQENVSEDALEDVGQYTLDTSRLLEKLKKHKAEITGVQVQHDERLKLSHEISIQEIKKD